MVDARDIEQGLPSLGGGPPPWKVRAVVTNAADTEYSSAPIKALSGA
jgi:hypothetical protein